MGNDFFENLWVTHPYRKDTTSEVVLPHHAFHGTIGLTCVLSIFLTIVRNQNFTENGEINQLTDGHACIDPNWLFNRDFQGPVATKTHIALTCGIVTWLSSMTRR